MANKLPRRMSIPPLTEAMYRKATAEGAHTTPYDAVRVRYNRKADAIELTLRKGIVIQLPRSQIWELAHASPEDLVQAKVQPGGEGISFPRIDVHISVPGLLADELGSVFGKAMGCLGRGHSSPLKVAAARANGRKGGRPPKKPAMNLGKH